MQKTCHIHRKLLNTVTQKVQGAVELSTKSSVTWLCSCLNPSLTSSQIQHNNNTSPSRVATMSGLGAIALCPNLCTSCTGDTQPRIVCVWCRISFSQIHKLCHISNVECDAPPTLDLQQPVSLGLTVENPGQTQPYAVYLYMSMIHEYVCGRLVGMISGRVYVHP